MKRTTIVLTDEQAILLDRERRRRGVPATVVVRDALDAYFTPPVRRLPFVALGASGQPNTAQDAEEILAREWTYERLMGVPEEPTVPPLGPDADASAPGVPTRPERPESVPAVGSGADRAPSAKRRPRRSKAERADAAAAEAPVESSQETD